MLVLNNLTIPDDPLFSADFQPPELRRQRCERCCHEIADVECSVCRQLYCHPCATQRHQTIDREINDQEESKQDGEPHHAQITVLNLCPECGLNPIDFFCANCVVYQCESCWANRHFVSGSNDAHMYFCVEGAVAKTLRHAKWSDEFVEMAKMCRRVRLGTFDQESPSVNSDRQQQRETNESATIIKDEKRMEEPNSTDQREEMVTETLVKQERISETLMDMRELVIVERNHRQQVPPHCSTSQQLAQSISSIKAECDLASVQRQQSMTVDEGDMQSVANAGSSESAQSIPPVQTKQLPPSQRPAVAQQVVVDLTEEDEDDHDHHSSMYHHQQHQQSVQAATSNDNGWLASASSWSADAALSDEDPILKTLIEEYNRLSEVIYNTDQAIARNFNDMRRLMTHNLSEVTTNEAMQKRQLVAELRQTLGQDMQARNTIVARLVVYLKPDRSELEALLQGWTMDIPHAQTASHRRCAMLEAGIRDKVRTIAKLKRDLEDTMAMNTKRDFAEVNRLGVMIAEEENAMKELEANRLEEFKRLFQFSQQIQTAVWKLTSSFNP